MSYYRQGPHRGSGGVTIGVPPLTPMIRLIMIVSGSIWGLQFLLNLVSPSLSQGMALLFGLVPRMPPAYPELWALRFVWQPVTYMWLHSAQDIWHILLNMVFLWMLGGDLERRWGSRAFLRYYLVCGIGAAPFIIATGLLSGGIGVTIGASGAIYGVILAFGMLFGERTILFMMMFPMRARTFAIILFAIAFISSIGAGASGVSHIAHLGGMVVGYLYLKRVWRFGEFYRELRWKLRRRRFRVIPPDDEDRWIN